jgi:hypothetical protein
MSFEDELREKLRHAETQMPPARVSLQETLVGARRGLIVRYALATAAVLVAIAGGAFAANDLLGTDAPTPAPARSPSPEPTSTPSDSATEEETKRSSAVRAAKAWIKALGAGNRARSWDLMTAEAKASYDSYAAFESDTGLSEGWAMWAFAEDAEYYHHDLPSRDRPTGVVIVTIAGTRQLEGTTERGASAMAVHVDGDRALVDPFVDGSGTNIEPVAPTPREGGDSFEAGKPMLFEAYVPERSMEIYFFISTQPGPVPPAETEPAGGPRVLAHHRLDEPLPSGDYWVTITASLPDGSVWTSPVGFRVE